MCCDRCNLSGRESGARESVVFCCVERWVRQMLMSKYNIPYNKKLVNY